MVNEIGVHNQNIKGASYSFCGRKDKDKEWVNDAYVMSDEKKKHPITTGLKIQADKFTKAWTKYPKKGFQASKNADFYEFLTMGTVPYIIGSATMISVFNLAAKFFDTPAAASASKLGKKMGLGVLFYGIAKTFSKKLIEVPLNMKYGIDVNLPYEKKINELPEENNKGDLTSYEYHKVFESVDFPRWDLLYNNEETGSDRNSYYEKVGKKMGLVDENTETPDQKVKPKIKEKVVQARLFTTLSSFLWAAVGVGIAMQDTWDNFGTGMSQKIQKIIPSIKKGVKIGGKSVKQSIANFGKTFVESTKKFLNNESKQASTAGKVLLGSAIAMTLLGNVVTLSNCNKKGSKAQASSSLIDESKEKVIC